MAIVATRSLCKGTFQILHRDTYIEKIGVLPFAKQTRRSHMRSPLTCRVADQVFVTDLCSGCRTCSEVVVGEPIDRFIMLRETYRALLDSEDATFHQLALWLDIGFRRFLRLWTLVGRFWNATLCNRSYRWFFWNFGNQIIENINSYEQVVFICIVGGRLFFQLAGRR